MLDALHNAIVDRLSSDMPALSTCAAYPKVTRKIALDAVLIDLEELEPADFGTDKFDAWAFFTGYCIVDPSQPDAELRVRSIAATLAVRVSQEADFGIEVERKTEVLRVGEDNFHPDLEGYLVWGVAFRIGVSLGEDAWLRDPAAGVSVTQITVGDLDDVDLDHRMADGQEPDSLDNINLPDQPKG